MAFRASLLRELPWKAFELTEDSEYHVRLAAAGIRVEFAPEAWVASAMPTSLEAAEAQRARWETGDVVLARRAAPTTIAAGLRGRDVNRIIAGLELLIPPQSLLMAGNAALAGAAAAVGVRRAARISLAGLAGQAAFVLGGLVLVRAPAAAYRSLATAPLLAVRNARLFARLARGRRTREWVRTPRGTE